MKVVGRASAQGAVRALYARARSGVLRKKDALAEIVDNALDAGATRVDVKLGKFVVVEDDGHGCSDFNTMCEIFGSNDEPLKRTGRFGQGLKVAAIRFADNLTIDSRTTESRMLASVCWPRFHEACDYDERPWSGKTGTKIEVGPIRDSWSAGDIASACTDLSWTYRPALSSGARIVVNGRNLKPTPLPPLRDARTATLRFDDGRSAEVTAGIIDGDRDPGVEIFYTIRHICRLPPPQGTSGFFCAVDLRDRPGANVREGAQSDGVWRFGWHKTEIARDQSDELRTSISSEFWDLVRRSQQEPFPLPNLCITKARTDRGGNHDFQPPEDGSGASKGKSGKHQNPNAGDGTDGKAAGGGIHMVPDTFRVEWKLGEAREPPVVALNLRNPFIKHLWDRRERSRMAKDALATVCALLVCEQSEQVDLPLPRQAHEAIGRTLARYQKRNAGME